jgi:hypothetical protein
MRQTKDPWDRFGFHDVTCEVPADWDPTHIEGTYEKGYVRLDDADAPRLEIRWERAHRRVSLSRTIDNHVKLITKEERQQGREVRVQRGLALGDLPFEEYEFFSYKNHIEAIGLAVRCAACGRVVVLRVLAGERGETIRPTALRVFKSLRDHPEDGRSRWGLYGFRFETPADFRLVGSDLKTGRLRFDFAQGGSRLTIARAALASVVLKERTLGEWLEQAMPKLFHGFVVERRSEEFRGHPALVVTGRYKLRLRIFRLMLRPPFLSCRVWHCRDSDKIYLFQAVGREKDKNALEKCLDLVYCH